MQRLAVPALQFQDLLGMNPYVLSDGNMVDKVQQNSMEDFYRILQYYMPPDYLHNFIAASPPDIGDIRDIAENDEAKNSQWYRKLSVPYLVQALSTGKDQATKKLNARRAQAVMKQSTSTSEVFRDQTARLYSHEWQKKFPLMSQFLADQQANATSHNPAIVADAEQWIAEIEQGLNKSTDPDEQQQLQQMVSIAENARKAGKSGKYWAYIFFQYLTSPNYLTMLRMQLLDGNTSQNLSQDIQRYSAILSILDPTSFFTRLFVQVVGIFQLTSLLPSLLDIPGNLDQFTFFMQKVLEAFMEKYIESQDPQMAKQAKDVQEGLKVTSIMGFLRIFASAAATVNSNTWEDIVAKFESQAIAKLGPVVSALANISLLGAVAFGIVNLANGTISFDELKSEQQALFISQCVNVVVLFSQKGIRSGMAYQATGSLWEAMKFFLIRRSLHPRKQLVQCLVAGLYATAKPQDHLICRFSLVKWLIMQFNLRHNIHASPKYLEEILKSLWLLASLQLWQLLVL